MARRVISIVLVVMMSAACGSHPEPALGPVVNSPEPRAVMRSDGAWFVFPVEDSLLHLNVPGARYPQQVGSSEHGWEVVWWPGDSVHCTAPSGIWLWTKKQPGPARDTSLVGALRGHRPEVLTAACDVQTPVARTTLDDGVTATVLDGRRVVLQVRGTAAMRRILGNRPDTVRLVRHKNGQPWEGEPYAWIVPVERQP